MKKFKTLIPAFCAMLVSAVMLGTSTYAWFSVNKKVTATGMNVEATANTLYFVVSQTEDFSDNNTTVDATHTVGGIDSEAKVYPAAYGKTTPSNKGFDGWWTANVNEYNATTDDKIYNESELGATDEAAAAKTDYFVGYTFYVGVADKSNPYTGTLKIKASAVADKGVEVAFVKIQQRKFATDWSDDGVAQYVHVAESTSEITTNSFVLKDDVNCLAVTVYVYVNGNNVNVKDANVGTLSGSVSIQVGANDITLA